MTDEKKKKIIAKAKNSSSSIELMGKVAKALFQSMLDTDLQNLEAFEQYSHSLQKKLLHSEEEFLSHFQNGYQILLNELSEKRN